MDCLKAEDEDKLGGPPRRVFEYVITNGGIASEMNYPFTGVFGAYDQEKVCVFYIKQNYYIFHLNKFVCFIYLFFLVQKKNQSSN
ncbi:putative zingipain [Helianthus annuus]|nr:putative zingipain [Helianthus annuus]